MATLQADGICKAIGGTAILKGVSLDLADGEFVSLVGPSGCGKSTFLRIVAGLESPDAGRIRIGGREVTGLRAADRDLAMVFQSYALYPHLTVAENIAVPLRMRRLGAAQRLPLIGPYLPGARSITRTIAARVDAAARMLEIGHLLDRKPGQLSGGQRQRVALGRAMVREPAAFLLDEPLSNLDAKMRVQMRAEIAALNRRLGATFLYVTHDQAEAMTMSDRIAVMMEGELLQVGAPDELYSRPADIRVAQFIGSPAINLLPVETGAAGRLALFGTDIGQRAAPGVRIEHLGLRPEALLPDPAGPIGGLVRAVENLGSDLFVQVEVPGLEALLVARCAPALRADLAPGARMRLSWSGVPIAFDAAGRAAALAKNREAVHV